MSVTFASLMLKIPKVSIKIFHMVANIDVAAVAINVLRTLRALTVDIEIGLKPGYNNLKIVGRWYWPYFTSLLSDGRNLWHFLYK